MRPGYCGKNTFLSFLNKHAPCRLIRKRNKPAPWINSTIKKQMLLRDLTKKKAQKSGLAKDWKEYRMKQNQVNIEVKQTKKKKISIRKNLLLQQIIQKKPGKY